MLVRIQPPTLTKTHQEALVGFSSFTKKLLAAAFVANFFSRYILKGCDG